MPASIEIEVFGLKIKSLSYLCQILGYKKPISKSLITVKYGTLENLVQTRLKADSAESAKIKLMDLLGCKESGKMQVISDSVVTQCAKAYIKSVLNQDIDTQSLQVLMRAFNVQDQSAVIGEIERLKNEI
ncbi:hypothetical protein [Succinatimonas hippei]|uniref:hypothetical protein n=1 Tax=Succinatimonas hippei TaxID=626938 RepID=UPI00248F4A34|nr:hypothetical protein [Succinatimonas hippei]